MCVLLIKVTALSFLGVPQGCLLNCDLPEVSPQNGHDATPSPPPYGVSPIQLAEATHTPEHIESIQENMHASALPGRRRALRQAKAQEFRGHKFVKKYFMKPTYCAYCKEMLW